MKGFSKGLEIYTRLSQIENETVFFICETLRLTLQTDKKFSPCHSQRIQGLNVCMKVREIYSPTFTQAIR